MTAAVVTAAICAWAAWRMQGNPLFVVAAATAAANGACSVFCILALRRGAAPARPVTALRHVSAALGLFFLLVSFSL